MSTFESNPQLLKDLLADCYSGRIQLPDFQRGWVWDDNHIRDLLVSVSRSFPIGAVMLLETGGEARFQVRPVEHAPASAAKVKADMLILDGQQRLTSLTQVLMSPEPVETRNEKGKRLKRHYYIDINAAIAAGTIEEALIGVDENKQILSNFGRDIDLDLSSREAEFEKLYFPCNRMLECDDWELALGDFSMERLRVFMQFRREFINPVREYKLPVIKLMKETSKEAVCLVFEKVNTGGVPLSVFELMTATFAADGCNLRDLWFGSKLRNVQGISERLVVEPVLDGIQATDFLQTISLLYTRENRIADIAAGKTGKLARAVSMKRVAVLALPLAAYKKHEPRVEKGYMLAARFLRKSCFYRSKDLPYSTQIVPLAAILTELQERWLEPQIYTRLAQWFWCGSLGELYGGAVETRSAIDVQEVLDWVLNEGPEPRTVTEANFQADRLDTLRTRNSAAYKALHVLLMRQGCEDFFWKATVTELDTDEVNIDIHHIFPIAWCDENNIAYNRFQSIVNKTAISYKANRMIGGQAPSAYLKQLEQHKQVMLDEPGMDAILSSHGIDPHALRTDDFDAHYEARKTNLLGRISEAMGKEQGNVQISQELVPLTPELARLSRDVEQVERSLRRQIQQHLEANDTAPWKRLVPGHIKTRVQQRIDRELKVNATRSAVDFETLDQKLEWLELMECADLICSTGLWPSFESLYRNKDILRSKFGQLAGLRNALRHSRTVTPVIQQDGKAAVLYFNSVTENVKESNESKDLNAS